MRRNEDQKESVCLVSFHKDSPVFCVARVLRLCSCLSPVGVTCWGVWRGAGPSTACLCLGFSVLLEAHWGAGGPGWGASVVEGGWSRSPRENDL